MTLRQLLHIRHPWRLAALLLAGALLIAGIAFATYRISQQLGLVELQNTGRHRLALYTASLEREIVKYAYFPSTLGLEQSVLQLLNTPGDPRLVTKVNSFLEQLNERAGTLSIYVMDTKGQVHASSNWRRADSFVGEDLSFRSYFRDAMDTGTGRFFGIGTTRSEPGYYLSSVIDDRNRTLGVAIVKVSLEQLEKSWSTVETPVIVSDEMVALAREKRQKAQEMAAMAQMAAGAASTAKDLSGAQTSGGNALDLLMGNGGNLAGGAGM